jgi:cell division protein FtsW (lipid II flippase)
MPLPFISYGGSSVLMLFFMVGVLINIHRQGFALESGRKSVTFAEPIITPRL